MENKKAKYFVISSEEGDINILSMHDKISEACEALHHEVYDYKDKILARGIYNEEKLKIRIELDTIAPNAEIEIFNNVTIYFMVCKFYI